MKTRSWRDKGALLALAAAWGICAAANTGMAWFDYGIVQWFNAAATALYIVIATVLIFLSWRKPVWAKFLWRFAWLSLICCLVCWYCSLDQRAWGLLFAPLAGIAFYGLRMWTNWQITYLGGGAISAVWVLLAWRGVTLAGGRDAGVKAMLMFLVKTAGIVALCVALFFVNAFAGNPVSALLARVSAHRYVAQEYGHLELNIDKVGYNLKDTNYYAKVSSHTSVDTYFTVYISMLGQVERDTYESVTDGWNTWNRLNDGYGAQVKAVLARLSFESDGGSGDFRGSYSGLPGSKNFGLPHEGLELDKEYDLYALGKEHGSITYRVLDKDISYERAAEILTCLRDEMERAGISFRVVNLTLRQPRDENGRWSGPELMIFDFPCADLYSDGLEEKIRLANGAAMDYYGEENLLG